MKVDTRFCRVAFLGVALLVATSSRSEAGTPVLSTVSKTAGPSLSFPMASACDQAAVPEARTQPPAFGALATSVCETPDVVRLRILASGDVDPGSVEIRFLGRQAIVRARGADGRVIRSQPFRLPARIVEVGSSADYDAEGALVMTFRRHATVQDATRPSDPEIVRCPPLDALAERK